MTYGEAKTRVLKLIDEYSNNGDVINETEPNSKDYIFKMPELFDDAQRQAAEVRYIRRAKEYNHYMPKSEAGAGHGTYVHEADDISFSCIIAKAYTFETCGSFTAYVEEYNGTSYAILNTISGDTKDVFTRHYGLIAATSTAVSVRLRFTGAYRCVIRNIALYNVAYPAITDIPEYKAHAPYTVPTDYYKFGRLTRDGEAFHAFTWISPDTIGIPYDAGGAYRLEYCAYPLPIATTVADAFVFEVDETAAKALPYYVAAKLLYTENQVAALDHLRTFNTMLMNMDNSPAGRQGKVINTMWSGTQRGTEIWKQ